MNILHSSFWRDADIQNRLSNTFYLFAVCLQIALAVTLALVAALRLVNVDLLGIPLLLGTACGVWYFWHHRDKTLDGFAIRILAGFLFVLIVVGAVWNFLVTADWDSAGYHYPAAFLYTKGLNPFYQESGNLWIDVYSNGMWTLNAALQRLTGIFDAAILLHILLAFCCFFAVTALLSRIRGGRLGPVDWSVALLVTFNPIVASQFLSSMVDGDLSLEAVTLGAFLLQIPGDRKHAVLAAACTVAVLANIKSSGVFYAASLCAGAVVWYLVCFYRMWGRTRFVGIVAILLAAGCVSVAGIGWHPYGTNILRYETPFYPPLKYIKDGQTPVNLLHANKLTELAYLVSGRGQLSTDEAHLKLPGTFQPSEFIKINYATRIGGFGVFFGAMVTIFIALCFYRFLLGFRPQKTLLGISLFGIGISICFPFMIWFARYVPLMWTGIVFGVAAFWCGERSGKPDTRMGKVEVSAFVLFFLFATVNSADAFAASLARTYLINHQLQKSLQGVSTSTSIGIRTSYPPNNPMHRTDADMAREFAHSFNLYWTEVLRRRGYRTYPVTSCDKPLLMLYPYSSTGAHIELCTSTKE